MRFSVQQISYDCIQMAGEDQESFRCSSAVNEKDDQPWLITIPKIIIFGIDIAKISV